jgi:autotransporter family porin
VLYDRWAPASDGVAHVAFNNLDSLIGRAGLRLSRSWDVEDREGIPRPWTAWLRPNLHEFLGTSQTTFSSAIGPVPFVSDTSGTWVSLNAGTNAKLGRRSTFFANVSYDVGLAGERTAIFGKLGLRKTLVTPMSPEYGRSADGAT